ncbi:hypothetical protein GCM10027053_32660 [Intrasporangium mesophilum]
MESLARQSLPPDQFEVVVVLHGPGDEAHRAVERVTLGPLAGHEVELVDRRADTRAEARNVGVGLARGAWTTFVDGADTVSETFLEQLYAARSLDRVPAGRVVGTPAPAEDAHHVPPDRALGVARARGGKLFPTDRLREIPFDGRLHTGEDAVLSGHLFSRFDRQFVTFDLEPGRSGADYLTGGSAAPQSAEGASPASSPPPAEEHAGRPRTGSTQSDFETEVVDRIAVIAALTTDTQADPADRSTLTNALVAAELADLRRWAERHPERRPEVERALRAAGVRGVTSLRPGPLDGAAEGFALFHTPPPGLRSLVVVAGSARAINDHARMVTFLARNGFGVRVLHYRGRLKQMLRKLPEVHRVGLLPETVPWVESRVRADSPRRHRAVLRASREAMRVGRRVLPAVVPAGLGRPAYSRIDTEAAALLAEPGPRVILDREGRTLLRAYGDGDSVSTALDAHELALLTMRTAGSQLRGSLADAHAARLASRVLCDDAARTRGEVEPGLWAMVGYRLIRAGRLEASAEVLDNGRNLFSDKEVEGTGLPALAALQEILTKGNRGTIDVPGVVGSTLRDADTALADDLDRAVFLTTVAIDLLFTRRLHTAEPRSPIVSEPETFLAPLRETEVGRLLGRTTPARPPGTPRTTAPNGRRRVTVLPGAYPKFAKPVVDELSVAADVEVLDLSERQKRFTNTGVDPATVRERLLAATGHPPAVDVATADALAADVIFVDWADKGLTWVTEVVPEGTRIVVRLHGVDTLSAWLHTAEWEKVSDAIFPAEHMRRSAAAALGGRLDHVRQHVVPLPLQVDTYALPKSPAAAKTLGMVGWAQQVKDPLWALDVLAELRRHDPEWRLRLMGADFDLSTRNPVEKAAARAFHQRIAQDELWDAVDYVGYTSRLPEHFRDVGWALSTSRREGFHTGLVEMAASGAVPVVRDWPVYAAIGGAKDLYPSEWVVPTPQAAAERVLTISEAGEWAELTEKTVASARARFSGADAGDRLRTIVLGSR